MLKKGTSLGNIEQAHIVGPAPPEPTSSTTLTTIETVLSEPTTVHSTQKSKETATEQVTEDITKSLLTEVADCQRRQVHLLNERNESIFSKSEYDIGPLSGIS